MRHPLLAALCLLIACSPVSELGSSPAFTRVHAPTVTADHASTGGLSWADIDNDGDEDLLVTNGYDVSAEEVAGQPNRLYRNDGGSFTLITEGPLANSMSASSGATWGDYDNDGDLDVFIANQQDEDNLFFRNDGDWKFSAVSNTPLTSDGGHSYAATWVDIDADGNLDLFVANGGMSHVDANALYRNLGDGAFEKVTEGDLVTAEAATCGIAWGDYDNDGDLDLFLVNTGFAPPGNLDALYRNDGELVFTKIEDTILTAKGLPTCAATWVDVDNDLDLDLHVTVMYGLANRLFLNDGNGSFTQADAGDLTLDGGHTYGANFEDYDNDGDVDAVIAEWGAAPRLYWNDGHGKFVRAASEDFGSRVEHPGAIASADYDGDGRVDVLIGNWPNEPGDGELNSLFNNETAEKHWLGVRLVGNSIGARVTVTTASRSQMREVTSQHGFRGQSSVVVHFGLGEEAAVEKLEVRLPDGRELKIGDLGVDRVAEVKTR